MMSEEKLTREFRGFVQEHGWDLVGIADPAFLNRKARPGRRPMDLFPSAKAVLIIGYGMLDPIERGWVHNGKSGKFYSFALLELDRRVHEIRRFLRQTDYLDAEQPDNEGGIFAMISDNQNSNVRCDYLGLVPDGFDETIEIELFSYYIFEQDEENDKASDTESTFSSMQSLNSRHQVRKHL